MTRELFSTILLIVASLFSADVQSEEMERDFTCFQTVSQYLPELDIGSDVAIVYGVDGSFSDRVALWREKGYTASMMTGIAWGGYGDYYGSGDAFKKEEVQTEKSGRLLMHGNSTNVGYNVPSDLYVEYIKRYVEPAVDAGVQAVYLEEPEYWAKTGWSEGFKNEWQKFYGEPWQEPDSSVDAQYQASKLKYELYFNALSDVFRHIKERARSQGIQIECHVPTHSLINYAHWGIVSPESHLMDLEEMDGYIAQVWTGTARTPNLYRGVRKERTFETAFFEYGQMLAMVRPTGRKVWFLADPIEDNPNRSWNDYKLNYECTVIASLLWPEVHHFEVMPWPSRIFRGTYPKVDMDAKSREREGIPADYATQLLTVVNALNDMNQPDVRYDTGARGVGIIVSDTMMFQRAAPDPSDDALGSFYGLALPLLKHGIPAEVVQLENTLHPNTLQPYKVLFLTYEGQKPLKPEYHEALSKWVSEGGCLVYVGDGSDPYHGVREWWNEQGQTAAKPYEHLFGLLGIDATNNEKPIQVGRGYVRVLAEKPREIQSQEEGPEKVVGILREMLECRGETLQAQNHLCIRRGPYVVASVLDESVSDEDLVLEGTFVDLFDPTLPCLTKKTLSPGERTLLYDLNWLAENGVGSKVVAAGARVKNESASGDGLRFVTRGPKATRGFARILLPSKPDNIHSEPECLQETRWDEGTSTLWLSFENIAADVSFGIGF